MEKLEQAKLKLKQYNQEHIITILEKLTGETQEELVNQIISFDFEEIDRIFKNKDHIDEINQVEPINSVDKSKLTVDEIQELNNR